MIDTIQPLHAWIRKHLDRPSKTMRMRVQTVASLLKLDVSCINTYAPHHDHGIRRDLFCGKL